jgi:hypothetical protein
MTTPADLRLARDVRALLLDPSSWFRNANERGPQWRLDPAAALRTIKLRYPKAFKVFGEDVIRAAAPVLETDANDGTCRWCYLRERGGDPPPTDEANTELLGDPCPKCSRWLLDAAVERVHPGDQDAAAAASSLRGRTGGRVGVTARPARRPASPADLITMRRLGIVASAFDGHRPAAVIEREQRLARAAFERRARGLKLAGTIIDQVRRHKAIVDAAYTLENSGTCAVTSQSMTSLRKEAERRERAEANTPTGVRYLAGRGPGSGQVRPPSIMVSCEQPKIRRWPPATA